MPSQKSHRPFSSVLLWGLLLIVLLPVLAVCFLSLWQHDIEGSRFTMTQYTTLLSDSSLIRRFFNSSIIALGTIIIQLPLSIAGGLYFSRCYGLFRSVVLALFLVMLLLPFQSYMLPIFMLFKTTSLYNTQFALMLIGAFSPLGPLIVFAFMKEVPEEQWEAARLDTSSVLIILFRVILPQMIPALLMLLMITFAEAWNLVEPAIILLSNDKLLPVSVSLNNFKGCSWAGASTYALPVVLLYSIVCGRLKRDVIKVM